MSIHDFGMPHTYSDDPTPSHALLKEQLDRDVANFLASGKKPTTVATGVSGLRLLDIPAQELLRMPYWQRMQFYRYREMMDNAAEEPVLEDIHAERLALEGAPVEPVIATEESV